MEECVLKRESWKDCGQKEMLFRLGMSWIFPMDMKYTQDDVGLLKRL